MTKRQAVDSYTQLRAAYREAFARQGRVNAFSPEGNAAVEDTLAAGRGIHALVGKILREDLGGGRWWSGIDNRGTVYDLTGLNTSGGPPVGIPVDADDPNYLTIYAFENVNSWGYDYINRARAAAWAPDFLNYVEAKIGVPARTLLEDYLESLCA